MRNTSVVNKEDFFYLLNKFQIKKNISLYFSYTCMFNFLRTIQDMGGMQVLKHFIANRYFSNYYPDSSDETFPCISRTLISLIF